MDRLEQPERDAEQVVELTGTTKRAPTKSETVTNGPAPPTKTEFRLVELCLPASWSELAIVGVLGTLLSGS